MFFYCVFDKIIEQKRLQKHLKLTNLNVLNGSVHLLYKY